MNDPARDLTRIVLAVLFIGLLIGLSLWILRPFLGAVIWATMMVVATWPILLTLEKYLWGKRALAVTVMTLALLLLLLVPLWLVVGTSLAHVDDIVALAKMVAELKLPPPREWLASVPLFGAAAVEVWQKVAPEEAVQPRPSAPDARLSARLRASPPGAAPRRARECRCPRSPTDGIR